MRPAFLPIEFQKPKEPEVYPGAIPVIAPANAGGESLPEE
jgi:hypothetical protein